MTGRPYKDEESQGRPPLSLESSRDGGCSEWGGGNARSHQDELGLGRGLGARALGVSGLWSVFKWVGWLGEVIDLGLGNGLD